jgi:hypothetical protein
MGNFGMIAGENLTSFPLAICKKKNPQNEAFTMFSGIFLSKFLADLSSDQ